MANSLTEDGVAQSVEHWTANLATRVRSPVGEEPSDLICAFLHVQMESNWAGLSVCNCRHTGKWCGTIKAVGNTDHTRQTWIHMQTPLSPLAGCGPVGEGTSGKVLNWTVRSLNHAYTTTKLTDFQFSSIKIMCNTSHIFTAMCNFPCDGQRPMFRRKGIELPRSGGWECTVAQLWLAEWFSPNLGVTRRLWSAECVTY